MKTSTILLGCLLQENGTIEKHANQEKVKTVHYPNSRLPGCRQLGAVADDSGMWFLGAFTITLILVSAFTPFWAKKLLSLNLFFIHENLTKKFIFLLITLVMQQIHFAHNKTAKMISDWFLFLDIAVEATNTKKHLVILLQCRKFWTIDKQRFSRAVVMILGQKCCPLPDDALHRRPFPELV